MPVLNIRYFDAIFGYLIFDILYHVIIYLLFDIKYSISSIQYLYIVFDILYSIPVYSIRYLIFDILYSISSIRYLMSDI